MDFLWSKHASHILSLFRPHQPGDGYDEQVVRLAEKTLGVTLPSVLREFYLAWGTRDDLTRQWEQLLPPERLVVRSGTLVICVANESIFYRGIPLDILNQPDPLVYTASSGHEVSVWTGEENLEWEPTHSHVSDFLDALTYEHAFLGGALHGGSSVETADAVRINIVCQRWSRIEISATPYYLDRDSEVHRWVISGEEGQAIDWVTRFAVVTRTVQDLDAIGQTLGIHWRDRW